MSDKVCSVNVLTDDEDRDYLEAIKSLRYVRKVTGSYEGELDREIKELESKLNMKG